MKSNVILESSDRELMGVNIRQRTKDSYFSLKDITLVLNKWSLENGKTPILIHNYFKLKQTKELMESIKKEYGKEVYIRQKGRNSDSWIHPYLMIDMLLWVNPNFKVSVYKWMVDYLIQYRLDSGDSFNKMRGVLSRYTNRKDIFHKNMIILSKKIKSKIGVEDWNKASQEQLKKRDYLHNMISDMTMTFKNSHKGAHLALEIFDKSYGASSELAFNTETINNIPSV